MNPTKKKPAKRRPAKYGPSFAKRNPILSKLLDLKYRINDAYAIIKGGFDKDKFNLTMLGDTRVDKAWVMNLIKEVRNNNLSKLCKEDMLKCNEIWKEYSPSRLNDWVSYKNG